MNRHIRTSLVLVTVLVILSACNLPGRMPPTAFASLTPDLTLTAIFAVLNSPTPGPSIPTGTSVPTESSPPTSSPAPTETVTLLPPSPTATQMPPTATDKPTSIPAATKSYVGPVARTAARVQAAYFSSEPRIDGVFDEWNLDRYDATHVVYGANSWEGELDLSANFMIAWDEDNLYIATKVKDDAYVQNTSGENLFKGDSIEVLIDTNVSADYYLASLSGDDYQLGISPGYVQLNQSPEAYLWYPQGAAGARQKVKASSMPTENGYRVEIKIPWATIGVNPAKGLHLGFAFSVSDNDRASKNVQQTMVSNVSSRSLSDPTKWGDLELVGGPVSSQLIRPGSSVWAGYTSAAPAIDGNLSDWNWAPFGIGNVTYGADRWNGASDLSGSAMLLWDDENLYLAVRVRDNQYVQNARGKYLYLGDSLEILLDSALSGDFYVRSLSADDYQLGISPGYQAIGDAPEAYLWFPRSQEGAKSQVKIAARQGTEAYEVEAAVPWELFDIVPRKGQIFGFVLSLSDNDNENSDVQQSLVSNNATRVLVDPATWGNLGLK